MTLQRLWIACLALLSLTACPQAFIGTPGGFEANKTSSSSSGDPTDDKSAGTDPLPTSNFKEVPPPAGGDVPFSAPPPPSGGEDRGGVPIALPSEGSNKQGQMYAYAGNPSGGPGPMFPKPDGQDTEHGRPHPHLLYGEDFSQSLFDHTATVAVDGAEPFDLKLLLVEPVEKGEGTSRTVTWIPEENGPQVRVVYRPPGRDCENFQTMKYADAMVAMTPDGSNVNFQGLHARSGLLYFILYKHAVSYGGAWYIPLGSGYSPTSDFNGGDFTAFPSKTACEASQLGSESNTGSWVGELPLQAINPGMMAPALPGPSQEDPTQKLFRSQP